MSDVASMHATMLLILLCTQGLIEIYAAAAVQYMASRLDTHRQMRTHMHSAACHGLHRATG